MPELPEIVATARLLSKEAAGFVVAGVVTPGIATVKTFDPPISRLEGAQIVAVRQRAKLLLVDFEGGSLSSPHTMIVHVMSSGRLQLVSGEQKLTARGNRLILKLAHPAQAEDSAGMQLRLREFGTKQAAWVKLVATDMVDSDESVAKLGPDCWPVTPDLLTLPKGRPIRGVLRDQRIMAGIGRAWSDEILWDAQIAPLQRAGNLSDDELQRLGESIHKVLQQAVDHYCQELTLPFPDKYPHPPRIHRNVGSACPRCGEPILAVHYESDEMAYCATCQTGGKPYKDRRLSKLLIQ